jgi:hypothetical protein
MKQLWLDRQWGRSFMSTVAATIKTHNRWMTVLGAAIVFAMFVVKDAYRDELKDVANSIAEAQNFFAIEASFVEVDKRLESLQESMRNGQLSTKLKMKEFDTAYIMLLDLEQKQKEQAPRIGADLANIYNLQKHVPDHEKEKDDEWQLFEELSVEAFDVDALIRETNSRSDDKKAPSTGVPSREMRIMADLSMLNDFEHRLQKLRTNVLADAESEREICEKRVRQSTIASYILYPLGWVIGLLGKLYGDGEAPELE